MSSIFSFGSKSATSSRAPSVKSAKTDTPKTSEIFTTPVPGCEPKKKWEYTAEQLQMIEDLKAYSKTIQLPSSDPYYPWEQRFLADPGTHPRYMRASKWKPEDAKRRIKGTLEWRREYKPELIEPGDVGIEAETGKIILSGFDNDARPILYMRPGRENTERSDRQIRHLIYHLERAIDFCPPGQEQVAIIVDYKSATSQTNPSIGVAKKVLNILQNHYVERLGRGLVVNMPWWINAFFSGISPFMDPITRDKIRFNPNLLELVPAAHLDSEFGGDYNLDFNHKVYWQTITEFCHIAPNGGRVDNNGNEWFPPAGNGIKAAVDGLVPREGAVATGQLTEKSGQSESEKVAADHRAQANATTETEKPAAAAAAAGTENVDGRTNRTDELSAGVAGLAVSQAPAQAQATSDGTGETGATVPEPPATTTKPGAPVGDGEVVFDHPPTHEEKEVARQSLEGGR